MGPPLRIIYLSDYFQWVHMQLGIIPIISVHLLGYLWRDACQTSRRFYTMRVCTGCFAFMYIFLCIYTLYMTVWVRGLVRSLLDFIASDLDFVGFFIKLLSHMERVLWIVGWSLTRDTRLLFLFSLLFVTKALKSFFLIWE